MPQGQGCWILEFLLVVYDKAVVSLPVCTEPLLLLLESLWNYVFSFRGINVKEN